MAIRVLIVDDDTAFRRTIAAVLAGRGYEIAGEASSLAEARLALAQLDPDAVLLDVQLPDGDGISFAAELPPTRGRPVRILLTSSDRKPAPSRLLGRSGVAGFIPKTELIATDLKPYFG
jgi:DNA-binding NarL/FixJ family response regulator